MSSHYQDAAASRWGVFRLFKPSTLAAGVCLGLAGGAQAQAPVTEFQAREKVESAAPTPSTPLVDPKSLAAPASDLPTVQINGFRISGAQRVDQETLAAHLSGFVGKKLSAADLQQAAQTVVDVYLRQGLLASVRVRSVSADGGIADLVVSELKLGHVRIDIEPDSRVSEALAHRLLGNGLIAGELLPLARLESTVAILNTQPGIAAAVAVDGGEKPDEVDVTLRLRDRPLWSGRLTLDNHGLREIGQDRLGVSVRADNAFGQAESAAIEYEKTAGSELVSPSFSLPLGSSGLRAGLEVTHADYRARRVGADLEQQGKYDFWRVFARQPLLRTQTFSTNADYGLQRTDWHDDSIFGELHRRRIQAATFKLSAQARAGETVDRVSVEILRGSADLSGNAADRDLDAASSRIDGAFWRLSWRLGHERPLGGGVLVLKATGQWADRNLDPTQQFSLGGPDRIRAYPTLEALGDGGWIATAEWRYPLGADLAGRLFLDTGSIQRNARPWIDQRNRYDLTGVGGGLTRQFPQGFRLSLDGAWQWGGNPGENVDGSDSDGRQARWRVWAALSRSF